jgi:hypothetical protein
VQRKQRLHASPKEGKAVRIDARFVFSHRPVQPLAIFRCCSENSPPISFMNSGE